MKKLLLTTAVLAALAGCQAPQERVPLQPLEENAGKYRYNELLDRARYQAAGATEAFYRNRWGELEEFARGLEQTARLLPTSDAVPARRKQTLPDLSVDLGKEASRLRESAAKKDVNSCNEAMTKLNAAVRELRPED